MRLPPHLVSGLIDACRAVIAANADYLCELDRRIGDGDHGTNMRRGCEAVFADREALSQLPAAEALERAGRILVATIGGASGPLYGTLLIEIGRQSAAHPDDADFAMVLKQAIDAVARRGRSEAGCKTLLDVLYPVQNEVARHTAFTAIAEQAERAAKTTIAMKALRGRAKFLGDRSIGHIDPGASSCALLTGAICTVLKEQQLA
ncbi:MAG: dihydroxyacetone kinase subunit DhaL [Allorhizobium sp.]